MEKEIVTSEIKLEVFTLVNFEMDVLEARQTVIDKLNEQDGVEKVEKVYVNKSDAYLYIDNPRSLVRYNGQRARN